MRTYNEFIQPPGNNALWFSLEFVARRSMTGVIDFQ